MRVWVVALTEAENPNSVTSFGEPIYNSNVIVPACGNCICYRANRRHEILIVENGSRFTERPRLPGPQRQPADFRKKSEMTPRAC